MSLDEKRTEVICTKLTERMALDLLRCASARDRSISDFLFHLIRHELYGSMVHLERVAAQSTSVDKVDQ